MPSKPLAFEQVRSYISLGCSLRREISLPNFLRGETGGNVLPKIWENHLTLKTFFLAPNTLGFLRDGSSRGDGRLPAAPGRGNQWYWRFENISSRFQRPYFCGSVHQREKQISFFIIALQQCWWFRFWRPTRQRYANNFIFLLCLKCRKKKSPSS